jgi:hypothetical protein
MHRTAGFVQLRSVRSFGNYKRFCLTPEPPFKPAGGSLFLFHRKALQDFWKDGHNWPKKKKDGKIVREAHERLKFGSVDVLHCYNAMGKSPHGEKIRIHRRTIRAHYADKILGLYHIQPNLHIHSLYQVSSLPRTKSQESDHIRCQGESPWSQIA